MLCHVERHHPPVDVPWRTQLGTQNRVNCARRAQGFVVYRLLPKHPHQSSWTDRLHRTANVSFLILPLFPTPWKQVLDMSTWEWVEIEPTGEQPEPRSGHQVRPIDEYSPLYGER